MKKIAFLALIGVFLLTACVQNNVQTKKITDLEDAAQQVIEIIKNKDLKSLAEYIHPNKGVRFSPYPYINTKNDIVFMPLDLKGKFSDNTDYKWGAYDGSGLPIELTFGEYFDKFVYDKDFVNAEKISLNKIIGTGNSINNIDKAYPDAQYVEFYFSGFDEQYGGMDWEALRLVFEKYEDGFLLVGIIHAQWTI
ncbi:hypothetical protein ACFL10_00625 [Patescibacteria group bacterium]